MMADDGFFLTEDVMTPDEAKAFIVKHMRSKNAMNAAFSLIANMLIAGSSSQDDAHDGIIAFADDLQKAVDDFYDGKLEHLRIRQH